MLFLGLYFNTQLPFSIFLDQITSCSSMLSFKGSPYWMAPEVIFISLNIFELIGILVIIISLFIFAFTNI